jgi:hypothetical protein
MTRDTLHISTQVLPSNKIEIETPELVVGQIVEVFIISSIPPIYLCLSKIILGNN